MNETIRRAICRSGGTRGGAFPYRKQKTPQFDDRIRKQRVAYANYSPIGLAARDGGVDEEKEGWIFWDHTPPPKQVQSIEVMTLHGLQKRIGTLKVFPQQDPQNFQSRYTVTVTR